MSTATFSGPIQTGTVRQNVYANVGKVEQNQDWTIDVPTLKITTNTGTVTALTLAAGTFDCIIYVPALCQITDFIVDVTTVYNQGGSAAVTIGSAAGGTQFMSSVDIKSSTGRIALTYTAAQLLLMSSVTADATISALAGFQVAPLYLRVTSVGSVASTGHVIVTCRYQQN